VHFRKSPCSDLLALDYRFIPERAALFFTCSTKK